MMFALVAVGCIGTPEGGGLSDTAVSMHPCRQGEVPVATACLSAVEPTVLKLSTAEQSGNVAVIPEGAGDILLRVELWSEPAGSFEVSLDTVSVGWGVQEEAITVTLVADEPGIYVSRLAIWGHPDPVPEYVAIGALIE